LNSIIYQSLNTQAKKKLQLAFREAFQDARRIQNIPFAFCYLESCLSVALNNARKDRDESLALQKKEELEAGRAMATDMGPGADERRGKKNEMAERKIKKEELEADMATTTDMVQGADERREKKNEMAERKIKKEELEADMAMATDMVQGADERRGEKNEMAKRKRKKLSPGADERRVKKNEMSKRKRKKAQKE